MWGNLVWHWRGKICVKIFLAGQVMGIISFVVCFRSGYQLRRYSNSWNVQETVWQQRKGRRGSRSLAQTSWRRKRQILYVLEQCPTFILFIMMEKLICWEHFFFFGNRRASCLSSWALCGIPCHGWWKLLLSWPLFWQMEG